MQGYCFYKITVNIRLPTLQSANSLRWHISVSFNLCTYLLIFVFWCSHLFLLSLAVLLIRDEDTYGEVAALRAILVFDQDAVFARVAGVNGGDGEAGKLARLKLQDVMIIRHHLSLVLQPGHFRHWVTRDITCEIQGLEQSRSDMYKLCIDNFTSDDGLQILFSTGKNY